MPPKPKRKPSNGKPLVPARDRAKGAARDFRAPASGRRGARAPDVPSGKAARILERRAGRRLKRQRTIPEIDFSRRIRYETWFRAMGTVGRLTDFRNRKSPDLMKEDLEDFAAPAAWTSNQSGLLGQVKFNGIVSLEDLIDRLNTQLQFSGDEIEDFDFRLVYPRWRYRYEVFEIVGPTVRSIQRIADEWPRRRR